MCRLATYGRENSVTRENSEVQRMSSTKPVAKNALACVAGRDSKGCVMKWVDECGGG